MGHYAALWNLIELLGLVQLQVLLDIQVDYVEFGGLFKSINVEPFESIHTRNCMMVDKRVWRMKCSGDLTLNNPLYRTVLNSTQNQNTSKVYPYNPIKPL